jgi:hypothetical protein
MLLHPLLSLSMNYNIAFAVCLGDNRADGERDLVQNNKKRMSLQIRGVSIDFPYAKPYASQLGVMSQLLQAVATGDRALGVICISVMKCATGENALLESPTGSGKTMALLCAALAWQKEARDRVTVRNDPAFLKFKKSASSLNKSSSSAPSSPKASATASTSTAGATATSSATARTSLAPFSNGASSNGDTKTASTTSVALGSLDSTATTSKTVIVAPTELPPSKPLTPKNLTAILDKDSADDDDSDETIIISEDSEDYIGISATSATTTTTTTTMTATSTASPVVTTKVPQPKRRRIQIALENNDNRDEDDDFKSNRFGQM